MGTAPYRARARARARDFLQKQKSLALNKGLTNKGYQSRRIENIANHLIKRLKSDNSHFAWFCKVAYHLDEDTIWSIAERAKRPDVRDPIKYFSKACKNELIKRGVK